MDQQTKEEAKRCGADPAEAEGGKRQEAADGIQRGDQRSVQPLRQGVQQIKKCSGQREADGSGIDGSIITEAPAEQRQQNQDNGQRIQEHQHRCGVVDDGAEA